VSSVQVTDITMVCWCVTAADWH